MWRRCQSIYMHTRPCQHGIAHKGIGHKLTTLHAPHQAQSISAHPRCPAPLECGPGSYPTPCPRRTLLTLHDNSS